MTTTNRLCYTVSKRYIQAGTTFEINVKILLADDCKNNICDWSITADIYEQRKNGRFVWCAGGCCHEYKDGLCKDGIISQSLYERATLY